MPDGQMSKSTQEMLAREETRARHARYLDEPREDRYATYRLGIATVTCVLGCGADTTNPDSVCDACTRERWGTCCPFDPACDHSYLDDEALTRWFDTPLTDRQATDLACPAGPSHFFEKIDPRDEKQLGMYGWHCVECGCARNGDGS